MLNIGNFRGAPLLEQRMLLSSTSQGHIVVIALFWVYPLYVLLVSGERVLLEQHQGIDLIEKTRLRDRKTIDLSGLVESSWTALIVCLGLLVNSALVHLLIHDVAGPSKVDKQFMDMIELFKSWHWMGHWVFTHPASAYLVYVLLLFFILTAIGFFTLSLIRCFPDRKIAYPITFIYWLAWWFTPLDLSMAMQPFTEYGLSYAVTTTGLFCGLTLLLAFGVLFVRRWHNDQI
ncbi:hypothetical protein ACFQ4P_07230 [Lacticaseibacillus mingshuiensis]|uniref:Uncharacterized protein n=1 Tax=Lacticaseibacillus mingshuiensis TaxID=2799574 RepID=A0ABW4CJW0_9LACO